MTGSRSVPNGAVEACWIISDLRRSTELFSRWSDQVTPYLHRIAFGIVGDRVSWDLVDEVVNVALERIWSARDQPRTSCAGWLRARVRSAAKSVLRSYGMGRGRRPGDQRELLEPVGDSTGATATDADLLRTLFQRLQEDDRAILLQITCNGASMAQVGAAGGYSGATACRRFNIALRRARALATALAA